MQCSQIGQDHGPLRKVAKTMYGIETHRGLVDIQLPCLSGLTPLAPSRPNLSSTSFDKDASASWGDFLEPLATSLLRTVSHVQESLVWV